MTKLKTIKEIKERRDRLNINLKFITNLQGIENVKKMIKWLDYYLENQNLDLYNEIRESDGTKKQMLRWIKGDFR